MGIMTTLLDYQGHILIGLVGSLETTNGRVLRLQRLNGTEKGKGVERGKGKIERGNVRLA